MDKSQAIYNFWNSFGIPAYDAYTVPDDAQMPYITYEESTASFDQPISLTGTIWYHSTSWKSISEKASEIAWATARGYVQEVDDGYLYIVQGTPFSQRRADASDEGIRGLYIILSAEFITEH